ncbi:MAG: phytanoyl-CoA dioxygenase family protein, partial [Novosphingobium sp.]|nr:phytanoyl-CoA dioxygenase family protein [Novosphingobium sp.]
MKDIYPSRHAEVAEFLPRLDPVVHSDWREDAPLSREQAARFDRDGYLVLEDIFSDDEIAFLQREAGTLLADPAALEEETVITEPDGREIRSIFKIHAQSRVLARLAADERLAGVA